MAWNVVVIVLQTCCLLLGLQVSFGSCGSQRVVLLLMLTPEPSPLGADIATVRFVVRTYLGFS